MRDSITSSLMYLARNKLAVSGIGTMLSHDAPIFRANSRTVIAVFGNLRMFRGVQ